MRMMMKLSRWWFSMASKVRAPLSRACSDAGAELLPPDERKADKTTWPEFQSPVPLSESFSSLGLSFPFVCEGMEGASPWGAAAFLRAGPRPRPCPRRLARVGWLPGRAALVAGALADTLCPVSFAGSLHVLRPGHSVRRLLCPLAREDL